MIILAATLAILLSVNQLFNLRFFVGYTMLDNQYLYSLLGLLLPLTFLAFPIRGGMTDRRLPWYDALLAIVTIVVCCYFVATSEQNVDEGWEFAAPEQAVWFSVALWGLLLEGCRRAGGIALFIIVFIISLYPTYADMVPGPISGFATTFSDTAAYHALSTESVLGIPMRAFGQLVLGFLIFGVALQHTGAGRFFINLAFALLGHVRGGPAKVAIFSSGLMGSMSGSVITNVLTTGVMTIPAMRRVGISRSYAAGIEACASTGGVLMPPIMGATAFVMASILNVPYAEIAIAAVIPSVLYFFGLFMQIDAYSAREGLKGLPAEEMPTLRETFKEGWYFVAVFVLLVWMLVYLNREALAPYYATVLLIAINQVTSRGGDRWDMKKLLAFVEGVGLLFAELAAILAGIGLIVGALSVTGMAGTLVNDLIHIAGGSTILLLVMGAITSFILGIGMTVTAAYIFLAIVLAPALIQAGLDPFAVHLFILYWGMLSYITPPVALGAFAAATLAGSTPMRTGFEAMRLGSIIYFIPFFFVFNSAYIMRAPWPEVLTVAAGGLSGVVLLAGGLQGYLIGIGTLKGNPFVEWPVRLAIAVGGILLATPGGGLVPVSNTELNLAALVIAGPAAAVALMLNRRAASSPAI
ncbi:TRAP transporter permease [Oceanibacterium hippocampi]|uniref:TRAP transporter permease n=1 Tax=Oceanibacterium hippocampi TaxID=745714 RepID=UPI001C3887C1|nr:TRAP transporter fused permease subunit [Oceanibacterium hippocampi]